MSEYSTTIRILEIKTNREEFDGHINKKINQNLLENLSKEEYRKLLIDYLVHLGLDKIQTNPLHVAAKHEMQSKDVKSFINKLQYTPQKVDDLPLLLVGRYHIPPAIARLVAKNIIQDKNMEIQRFGKRIRYTSRWKGKRGRTNSLWEPLADVMTSDKEVKVVIEMPGVTKENIKVNVHDNSLEVTSNDPQRKYREVIDLPPEADIETAKSNYKNGIVEVVFKKKEQAKHKGKEIKVE